MTFSLTVLEHGISMGRLGVDFFLRLLTHCSAQLSRSTPGLAFYWSSFLRSVVKRETGFFAWLGAIEHLISHVVFLSIQVFFSKYDFVFV